MGCLDLTDKIALIINQMQISKQMLDRDDIRPDLKQRLEEDLTILKGDVSELYKELFKIISN